jgi:hypothetical protein
MIGELDSELDLLSRRWATKADDGRVKRTMAALAANGITALRAADGAEAKRIVLDLIPHGSQVHHGASASNPVGGPRCDAGLATGQRQQLGLRGIIGGSLLRSEDPRRSPGFSAGL